VARFDVLLHASGVSHLRDAQSELLSGLNPRVVVPLLPNVSAATAADRLNLGRFSPVHGGGKARAMTAFTRVNR